MTRTQETLRTVAALGIIAGASVQATPADKGNPTIVLVHGALLDGSS